jgi:hypothetical protein
VHTTTDSRSARATSQVNASPGQSVFFPSKLGIKIFEVTVESQVGSTPQLQCCRCCVPVEALLETNRPRVLCEAVSPFVLVLVQFFFSSRAWLVFLQSIVGEFPQLSHFSNCISFSSGVMSPDPLLHCLQVLDYAQ